MNYVTPADQIIFLEKRVGELESKIEELLGLCKNCNRLFTEIMPQAGKLVFQDYGLLNETLMQLHKL
jgi:hypothetical protein